MILTKILLISLVCCGIRKLTDEGMLLHGFKVWLNKVVKGPQPEYNPIHYNARNLPHYSRVSEIFMKAWEARGEWFLMPVINCIYCYASFWGSLAYWLLTLFVFPAGVNIQTLIAWPICCVAAVFLNGLLWGLLSKYEQFMQ